MSSGNVRASHSRRVAKTKDRRSERHLLNTELEYYVKRNTGAHDISYWRRSNDHSRQRSRKNLKKETNRARDMKRLSYECDYSSYYVMIDDKLYYDYY